MLCFMSNGIFISALDSLFDRNCIGSGTGGATRIAFLNLQGLGKLFLSVSERLQEILILTLILMVKSSKIWTVKFLYRKNTKGACNE